MTQTTHSIQQLAAGLGLHNSYLIPYGTDKAKVSREGLAHSSQKGKLILVTAITPTRAGEGKTTVAIGLAQGFARLGKKCCLALREPSLGPIFGMKGGATGGGLSKLVPEHDINLHFTGDFHAITSAHNLLAAAIDNHLHHGNSLGMDPRRVLWRRVIDCNDRSLRRIVVGLGGVLQGVPRETGFDITPASEVMAALCLAENESDLRQRLSQLLIGFTCDQEPVRASDLKAVGAMMALLKDAIDPNLVQTTEGVPAIIHGGPFANISHGCNSVLATKTALAHSDWTITEAGFGSELGAEKFFDIKCVSAGLDTAAVVLVATIRALKSHGGVTVDRLKEPDTAAVERGLSNLMRHIQNIVTFGNYPVVALNRFASDHEDEIQVVASAVRSEGSPFAVADIFEHGGAGGTQLAEQVIEHCRTSRNPFKPLYSWDEPVRQKMQKIASQMYGADRVVYTRQALRALGVVEKMGLGKLPLCVAKKPDSRPDQVEPSAVTVGDFLICPGAGYLVSLLGDMLRMPGLPKVPALERIDCIDGQLSGMS